ncbi:MAG: phosphatase PAP2 family protein [Candidatus Paceibacterota bacterium]
MVLGIGLFKYTPIALWGNGIQFDASLHVTTTIFFLYVIWYFIDQNKRWRVPFFIVSTGLVVVISVQRLFAEAHNEVGILLAFALSAVAITLSRPAYFRKHITF